MLKRRNRIKSAWKLLLPEKYASEPYVITTSPVVLGGAGTSDIVINDPSVSPSHIQFILVGGGKFLEVYNLAGAAVESGSAVEADGADGAKTLLNGEAIDKIKIKAQHDKFYTLRAGNVHIRLLYAPIKAAEPSSRRPKTVRQGPQWYYIHEGHQYGPLSQGDLVAAVQDGQLFPLDDAWHTHMKAHIKAFEIPDLFGPLRDRSSSEGKAGGKGESKPRDGKYHRNTMVHSTGALSSSENLPEQNDAYHASIFGDALSHGLEDGDAPGDGRRCPHCWYRFKVDALCYISRHPELMGDPVLGSEAQRRFLPREFRPVRRAVDSRGEICTEMACPRCHLRIPTPFLDTTPIFFSIIGTPGSGKSYYLAGATWMLRKMLPRYFGLTFEDVDNVTNEWLNRYEEALFFPVDGETYHVIEKTQIEAVGLSQQVKINDITMLLPQPAMFTLIAREEETPDADTLSTTGKRGTIKMEKRAARPPQRRTLAVYDNAGEHFQTGQDVIQKPGTLHMLHAHGFLFLFDPTADPRFQDLIDISTRKSIVQTVYQQQKILIETIDRIRKYSDLTVTQKLQKPVVVGLSKVDLLSEHLATTGLQLKGTPLKWIKKGAVAALDMAAVAHVSSHIRALLYERTPEYVNTIESFAANVIYLPVSAIGHQPDQRGVSTDNVHPLWVEVPFLYILSQMGLIPS